MKKQKKTLLFSLLISLSVFNFLLVSFSLYENVSSRMHNVNFHREKEVIDENDNTIPTVDESKYVIKVEK